MGNPNDAEEHRYKKILADPEGIDRLLVDLFFEVHEAPPEEIVLDLDATDDPLYGKQEDCFFCGYYGFYCYLPLYIFCGPHVLCFRLRKSDASKGSVDEASWVVGQIRRRWPRTRIVLRGDSGFCRNDLMEWCEDNGVDFMFGLARTARQVRRSRSRSAKSGKASRRYCDFRRRMLDSWSRTRRVVAKALFPHLPRKQMGRYSRLWIGGWP